MVPPPAILAAGTGFRRARALFYGPCPAASKWRGVGGGDYATSRSARGFLAAMSSRVCAAPEGARRPCSHSCSCLLYTSDAADE